MKHVQLEDQYITTKYLLEPKSSNRFLLPRFFISDFFWLLQIGGSNFLRKAPALQMLTSLCDGLFFVGKLSFQIMNGLGMTVPSQFIERNAVKEVLQIIQVARDRNIPIYYPTDLWCLKNDGSETLGVISSNGQLAGEYY